MKGTFKEPLCHTVDADGKVQETSADIAGSIGRAISKSSSSTNYNPKFQSHKNKAEKNKINFISSKQERYNDPFLLEELKNCIRLLNSSTPGPDGVHNLLLSHLPQVSLELLLEIFNDLWDNGKFPDSWREAAVIPIPKPGKDHTNPSNFRPIALTSCLCKLMERLVNKRLTWFLENGHILTDTQSGFRKNRSTVDQLVRLETFIRNAFIEGKHLTAVFFA